MCDVNFAHVFSSSGWNLPEHFEWCRTTQHKICFFTDYCLDSAILSESKRKIAWLLEPPAIYPESYDYVRKHIDMFDYVLTYDRTLTDNRKILYYPCGGCWIPDTGDQRNLPYAVNIHKKRFIVSIIASDKNQTDGHQLRHAIVKRYPQLSAYGPSYSLLEYKENALVDYMFSIVVENSRIDDYFTEKLIDCFAVGTIPIYWGTKNIGQYFNADGMMIFNDLDDLDMIIPQLTPDLYNSRLQHIQDNFMRHRQYRIAENWIFENYPHLFRT